MEVDFASAGSCKLEHVKRVRIKSSRVARGACAARSFAILLCWNRYCSSDCFGEARLDLRFDVSANGAESVGLELGELVADSADLFERSPGEETETHIGHYRPSGECGEYVEDRTFNPDAGRATVRRINRLHRDSLRLVGTV